MSAKEEIAIPKDYTYFHERLDVLGWTPENGRFSTPRWETKSGVTQPIPEGQWDYKLDTHERFDVDKEGNLVIRYFRITGAPATYKKGDGPARVYEVIRYKVPPLDKDGKPIKYRSPKGAGSLPWFHPNLIEAFRLGTQIDTLCLTEGPLKAECLSDAGAHIVGLTGITQARDNDKSLDSLHSDVVDVIRRCKPKKLVWLVDGDCKRFPPAWSPDAKDEENDLVDHRDRPNQFYQTCKTMRDLLQDLSNELGFSMWFKHVESGSVQTERDTPPKGVDDLLIAVASDRVRDAVARAPREVKGWEEMDAATREKELATIRLQAQAGAHQEVVKELVASSGPSLFFYRKSLDKLGDIKKYFACGSAPDYYAEYGERLRERAWVFHGTKYQHDGKELVIVLPAVMRSYVRVGDTYYERVPIPNRFGIPEEKLHIRQKSTISDDHGKEMVRRVQKLKAFCNTPSHEDYQPIIANCMNRYQPFEHKPEQGEFPHIEVMMKHIFGVNDVEVPHPKKKDEAGKPVMMRVNELELGYDYMQLLYRQPTHMLPILCLVSKENETGKSTLGKLLKAIYTGNAAFVSSADLQSDFNEHWISKLVVIIEEAFIEKKQTIERIKDLATASVAMVNSKGIQQQELEVFLHFVINSNNVRNFITATEHDIRYWVRNIPVIPDDKKNPEMEKLMYEEIPAFLYFLGKRSMVTERLSRMWFYPALLETEALRLVRDSSQPVVKRQLVGWLRMMMLALRPEKKPGENDDVTIMMTGDDLKREVFKGQGYDVDYIRRVVKEELHVTTFRDAKGRPATTAYSFHRMVEKKDPLTNAIVHDMEEVKVRVPARPFVFTREMLFTDQEWAMLKPDPDRKADNDAGAPPARPAEDDDLPF